jgi:ubiquinone biosynthesis protein UbiJ
VARGSVADFFAWFASGGTQSGNITFEGDETVLQEIADIFRRYAPDLGIPLSGLLGDDITAGLLNIGEAAIATLKSTAEGAGAALRHGASERYVSRASVDSFLDALDETRTRADRLAEAVKAAETRATRSAPPESAPSRRRGGTTDPMKSGE